MCLGSDRLINLAVGAVVVIVFLLIGRLKRVLRKQPGRKTKSAFRLERVFAWLGWLDSNQRPID